MTSGSGGLIWVAVMSDSSVAIRCGPHPASAAPNLISATTVNGKIHAECSMSGAHFARLAAERRASDELATIVSTTMIELDTSGFGQDGEELRFVVGGEIRYLEAFQVTDRKRLRHNLSQRDLVPF